MAQNIQFALSLYQGYENYKEKSLTHRRFKHSDIIPLIERLKNKNIFTVRKIGESVEGREIFLISIGHGPKKIFCWSQMHGDEPTATSAMFDVFNFFLAENHYAEFKHYLLNNVTLFFMPMVNPDGAELFQRRNIFEIDLNRDAEKQQSPESKILFSVFNNIKPEFGFNLHDQERCYSAGNTSQWSAISFLAPPFDQKKTINERRTKSMMLICELYNILTEIIPGHISKFSDDFEPRAFGDNFTKSGSSIVLLESGAWRGDREKQFIRKLNFVTLVTAFKCIAEDSFLQETIDVYHSIPENEKLMMDFIIRNVKLNKSGKDYVVDVGINYEEVNTTGNRDFYFKALIEDIGDLSVYRGFSEFNADGMNLEVGKTYSQKFDSLAEVNKLEAISLLENGITNIKLNPSESVKEYSPIMFNIILNSKDRIEELKEEANPNFILRQNGMFKYAVINGFLIERKLIGRTEGNALIFI